MRLLLILAVFSSCVKLYSQDSIFLDKAINFEILANHVYVNKNVFELDSNYNFHNNIRENTFLLNHYKLKRLGVDIKYNSSGSIQEYGYDFYEFKKKKKKTIISYKFHPTWKFNPKKVGSLSWSGKLFYDVFIVFKRSRNKGWAIKRWEVKDIVFPDFINHILENNYDNYIRLKGGGVYSNKTK